MLFMTLGVVNNVAVLIASIVMSVGVIFWLKGIIHKPVLLHFSPSRTILPLYVTMQFIFVKITVHPALHNFTTDIKACEFNPGTIWASLALSGSVGMSNSHISLVCICSPFGSVTLIGFVVGLRLIAGEFTIRKWLVAPESKMAHCSTLSLLIHIVCSWGFELGVEQDFTFKILSS